MEFTLYQVEKFLLTKCIGKTLKKENTVGLWMSMDILTTP